MSESCENGPGSLSPCGKPAVYAIRIKRPSDGWTGLELRKCVTCAAQMMLRFEDKDDREVELDLLSDSE